MNEKKSAIEVNVKSETIKNVAEQMVDAVNGFLKSHGIQPGAYYKLYTGVSGDRRYRIDIPKNVVLAIEQAGLSDELRRFCESEASKVQPPKTPSAIDPRFTDISTLLTRYK